MACGHVFMSVPGVDLIGPFKASKNGNRFCLTATDFFTKWVEARTIKDKTATATSQDCDVVITSVQPGQAYPASLRQRVEDFRAMLSNPSTLLDDHAMDHAQALLKAKYPNVNGLYATTSLALLSTLTEPAQGFVQILNVSANHWVTAGEVQLFPRAMRSPTAEPFAIDGDVHCLCRRTIGQGKAPLHCKN
ncbi:unnamed protein product [Boreogadus saida]